MVSVLYSAPSTSDIYPATTAAPNAMPTCGSVQKNLPRSAEMNCSDSSTFNINNEAWYAGSWTNPAAWLIIVYCVASACTLLLLMCHGFLDGHLNLDFSRAAASERELRRRRRNSQRMEDWIELERRQAEEANAGGDEVEGRAVHPEWPAFTTRGPIDEHEHEQLPTLYNGLDAMQRDALYARQVRDARVLANLERAGLL